MITTACLYAMLLQEQVVRPVGRFMHSGIATVVRQMLFRSALHLRVVLGSKQVPVQEPSSDWELNRRRRRSKVRAPSGEVTRSTRKDSVV